MRRRLVSGTGNGRRGPGRIGDPRTRRFLCPLLAVALMSGAVLMPVESANLPGELRSVTGTSPAVAQQSPWVVVQGNGGNECPKTPVEWQVALTHSECELNMQPCPPDKIKELGDLIFQFSVGYSDPDWFNLREYHLPQYHGFCELRVLDDDPTAFANCQGMKGLAVMEYEVERDVPGVLGVPGTTERVALCRLLQPAACPEGVRVDFDICRATQRRTWTCPPDYRLMNEFDRCYQPLQRFTGTSHPACGNSAPQFVVQSCEDYVGSDFSQSPDLIDCSSDYVTENPRNSTTLLSNITPPIGSSNHWCRFDRAYLKVDCHGLNPPASECSEVLALCLKRATRTGGCSAIANTIRCRALQADHQAEPDMVTVAEVRQQGCQPCVVLPFSSVPPNCPDDLAAEVEVSPVPGTHFAILRARADYNTNLIPCTPDSDRGILPDWCDDPPQCADPPPGEVTWSSSHFSQVAVVNSPVILTVRGIPSESRPADLQFNMATGTLVETRTAFPYPVSPAGGFGHAMARFGTIDPQRPSSGSVGELVGVVGECLFGSHSRDPSWAIPQFRMTIRELWPDNLDDRNSIERHFGSETLDWWRTLVPDEQRNRTLERGLDYWPEMLPADRESRLDSLTQEVDCNHEVPWCRWVPSRTGYFEVTGSGAWISTRWSRGGRRVLDSRIADIINFYLWFPANRQAVRAQLVDWGANPEDVGLADDLSEVLPLRGLHGDGRYSGSESRFSCGGTDIRIYCSTRNSGTVGNYTETDPVGIMVHEVRVATRAPNS